MEALSTAPDTAAQPVDDFELSYVRPDGGSPSSRLPRSPTAPRTGGMIGSLSQLIRGAALLAIEDGTEHITREHLDLVPLDYAAHSSNPAAQRAVKAV